MRKSLSQRTRRVLLICGSLQIGGAERQVVSDSNLLTENGWDVAFAYWMSGKLEEDLDSRVEKHKMASANWLGRFMDLLVFCHRKSFDVIQAHGANANFLASLAGWLLRIPVIVTEHGHGLWRLDRIKNRWADSVTYKLADKIVSVCETVQKTKIDRVGADPKKTVVMYNSYSSSILGQTVDIPALKAYYRIKTDTRVVGFVGRLAPVKRLDLLVSIAQKVIRETPDAIFLIVGDGPCLSELQALVVECGITGAFKFVGEQTEVSRFYKMIDVFVLTSEREAHSVALLEASASGIPVVAFDVGGNREIIEHEKNGYLIPFADVDGFADHLVKLLANEDIRKSMGNAAKQKADTSFSPAARLKALEALYFSLIPKISSD